MGYRPGRPLARERYPLVEREAPGTVRAEGACGGVPGGGTSILIMIGVALDTMSKVESQLKMHNYEGFFK